VDTAADSLTLIVEPNSRGHHLHYVGLLIEECHSKGKKAVVLTTKSAIGSAEWGIHLTQHTPDVVIHPPNRFELSDVARVAARLGASATILPDADGQILTVARRGWSGPGGLTLLVMRADVQPGSSRTRMRLGKTLIKRAIVLAADVRPRVRAFVLRSPLVPRRGPLRWVADPVKLRGSLQQIQAIRKSLDDNGGGERFWLGVFGDITPRKNLPLVLESVAEMSDIGLLIAGPLDPEVARNIAPLLDKFLANGGQVNHINGPLSDLEFDSAIGAVDCVVVAHSNEGPSGVVLKAVASGKRLVLAGAESLRQDAGRLGGQATWSPLETHALRQAIKRVRYLPEPAAMFELTADEFVRTLT